MDSRAYLTQYGWRGEGHTLHPSGRGIKKPLVIAKKTNVLGLGRKRNDVHADQWWARAFDSGLKGLSIDKSNSKATNANSITSVSSSIQPPKIRNGKWSGLYNGFVKGRDVEYLPTIVCATTGATTVNTNSKKRKPGPRKLPDYCDAKATLSDVSNQLAGDLTKNDKRHKRRRHGQ